MEISSIQTLRITLFGEFCLCWGECQVNKSLLRQRKGRDLIKLLALNPTHTLHREQIMDTLWPDTQPGKAANSLYNTLYLLRREFQEVDPILSKMIQLEEESVRLDPGFAISIDLQTFIAITEQAFASREPGQCQAAPAIAQGEFLPENRFDDWAIPHREMVNQHTLRLSHLLATLFEEQQQWASASQVYSLVDELNRVFSGSAGMEGDELSKLAWQVGVKNRAYYVVGAHMARTIDRERGPAALIETIEQGPMAFVDASNGLVEQPLRVYRIATTDSTSVFSQMKRAVTDDDRSSLAILVQKLRKDPPQDASTEKRLDRLGFRAIFLGRPGMAVDILSLNVDLFPRSANAHDSMGEACWRNRDVPGAIAAVQQRFVPGSVNIETIDGLTVEHPRWRFNNRSTNTEPLVRLNVESRGDRGLMQERTAEILELLGQFT